MAKSPTGVISVMVGTLAFIAPNVGFAQDFIVRGAQGRRTATIDRQGTDGFVVHDPAGRRTATIDEDRAGHFVIRNQK